MTSSSNIWLIHYSENLLFSVAIFINDLSKIFLKHAAVPTSALVASTCNFKLWRHFLSLNLMNIFWFFSSFMGAVCPPPKKATIVTSKVSEHHKIIIKWNGLKYCEDYQNVIKQAHTVGKNGSDRAVQCRIATSLQFV